MTERLVRAMLAMVTTWTLHGHVWTATPPDAATQARIVARAQAIAAGVAAQPYGVGTDRMYQEAAAALAVISFYETTFGHAGVEFGACGMLCRHHCGQCRAATLEEVATWAAGVLLRASTNCGARAPLPVRLGYYHSGACHADAFSGREAARVRFVLAGWGWRTDGAH
jgi:hypothetical protein